ncbi:uncharacterized protein BXZ73DRAFT_101185 [Epithele typhae]|uniref:uncharacterized protein n=1 Tax=Epithele typhae TaxID=378194 RepID=UPI0020082992|nr:uncharacterized protein BXZ73DRAFT_101185 [Epithele typhae]KAH9933226.1 hypothetical protein BXZ73DRAFT_101185 [Epithele typhae]
MSGSVLAARTHTAPSHPPPDTSVEDPAASLRAAALLTLRSKKKRKLTNDTPAPPPPRAPLTPPSIELDYGTDEPVPPPSSIASSPAMQPTVPPPVPQSRETMGSTKTPEPHSPNLDHQVPAMTQMLPPPLPQPKLEPLSPALSFALPAQLPSALAASTPSVVDEAHVRPGLALTQPQYDTAKDIVLDLLGWGVPPEYLVNCGLSREIIYYVFVELNLRLPNNLNATGLSPYIPSPRVPTSPSHRPSIVSAPPKSPPVTEPSRSLSASATPFVPSTGQNETATSSTSLNDMEQQRRAELLARKAVLASRKLKQQNSVLYNSAASFPPTSTPTPPANDQEAPVVVPTKAVEDFLSTIEPSAPHSNGTRSVTPPHASPSRTFSTDFMDVDEVPGLSGGITEYTPIARPIRGPPRSPTEPLSSVSATSGYSYQPGGDSYTVDGALSYDSIDDSDAIPGLFQDRAPSEELTRRGTKRPVASDFVDMEAAGPSHGQVWDPDTDFRRPTRRRKHNSFAGLTQRRCVIDLSDNEDDGEGSTPTSSEIPSGRDSQGPAAVTPQASLIATPTVTASSTPAAMSSFALEAKEEQIRQMKEMIARREQIKLRKLAMMSRSANPSFESQSGSAHVKEEDDDSSSTAPSLRQSRSSESSTPGPSSTEERSVIATLLLDDGSDQPTVSLPDSEFTSGATSPSDNTRQVCQYDFSGECRIKDCENLHLSKVQTLEPDDEDTAQFLCAAIPYGQRYGVEVFRKALDVARLSHPTHPFDARVQEALTRLGLR